MESIFCKHPLDFLSIEDCLIPFIKIKNPKRRTDFSLCFLIVCVERGTHPQVGTSFFEKNRFFHIRW